MFDWMEDANEGARALQEVIESAGETVLEAEDAQLRAKETLDALHLIFEEITDLYAQALNLRAQIEVLDV